MTTSQNHQNGKPLRVFIVSHACATPQNQRIFALAAADRGWHVTMCLPTRWHDEYGNVLPAQLLDDFPADLVSLPVWRNGSVPLHGYIGRLQKLLRDARPDVLYVHNEPYAISTIQWCWANHRSVHARFGFYTAQNICKHYPPPFRQGERWVYRNSQFSFPITSAVDQVQRHKGYQGESTVLPLGYDPLQVGAIAPIRERHLKSANRPVRFGYLGRIVEEKGLVTLAQALEQIRDKDWELMIAGCGPFEGEVKRALAAAGVTDRVQWIGMIPRDEVTRFYESIDLLVLPSETRPNWKEQFGRVIIESLVCGTPLVGSDSGEIPRLIEETGGGWVFAEANPTALAKVLRDAIRQPETRAQIGEHAEAYVAQEYALPALASRFADAIEEAVRQ